MAPRPNPRRALGTNSSRQAQAEQLVARLDARDNDGDGGGHTKKKPRFDARNPSTLADATRDDGGVDEDMNEEDAAILALDEIGKSGTQQKRTAVELDGFESDSSTENFATRAAQKVSSEKRKTQQKSKDEEEADMFADLEERDDDEDEEEAKRQGKKSKEVRFLDADEIEGQVAASRSGGHVSADFSLSEKGKRVRDEDAESTSSESGGEEERAHVGSDEDDQELGAGSKKKHAPKLDAFNMKQEGEEGRFDESGNYVRRAADPDAVHDSWMDGLSKKDMKRAAEAQQKRDDERRQKAAEDDALLTSDILETLITRLDKGETVLEALARLNKGKKKTKSKWQQKREKKKAMQDAEEMDPMQSEKDDAQEVARKQAVETLTGAADQLLTRGQPEIYDAERELLIRQWQRETGERWADPEPTPEAQAASASNGHKADGDSASRQWEYRWCDARDGGNVNGPYDGETMKAWQGAGYFADGVEFRQVNGSDETWSRSVDF